jgi:hypothetical protein
METLDILLIYGRPAWLVLKWPLLLLGLCWLTTHVTELLGNIIDEQIDRFLQKRFEKRLRKWSAADHSTSTQAQ